MEEIFDGRISEENDVYTESGIEEEMECDGMSGFEQGFMLGYLAS